MFKLCEAGSDDERAYIALFVLRPDQLQLSPRALIGVEITTSAAFEGSGLIIDLLFIRIKIF